MFFVVCGFLGFFSPAEIGIVQAELLEFVWEQHEHRQPWRRKRLLGFGSGDCVAVLAVG